MGDVGSYFRFEVFLHPSFHFQSQVGVEEVSIADEIVKLDEGDLEEGTDARPRLAEIRRACVTLRVKGRTTDRYPSSGFYQESAVASAQPLTSLAAPLTLLRVPSTSILLLQVHPPSVAFAPFRALWLLVPSSL